MQSTVVVVLILALVLLAVTLAGPPSGQPGGDRAIVAYTMPWCGACKRLQPEWDRLAGISAYPVFKVDCERDACASVRSYPTIVCNGSTYPVGGTRTAEAIWAWAQGC